MKQIIQAILNRMGYEVRRSRPLDTNYFDVLAQHNDIPSAAEGLAARFLHHVTSELAHSHAQRFQDLLADFIMQGGAGVFCEFGATDGITYSNSYFLQYSRNWKGILAEPSRAWHTALKQNRPGAIIDYRCVYSRSGEMVEFNEVEAGELSGIADLHGDDYFNKARRQGQRYNVETVSLVDLLVEHGLQSVDYLSVDTEGSELIILQSFDFTRFRPKLITVEHNYTSARENIHQLLNSQGYHLIFPEYSAFDAWYVLSDFIPKV